MCKTVCVCVKLCESSRWIFTRPLEVGCKSITRVSLGSKQLYTSRVCHRIFVYSVELDLFEYVHISKARLFRTLLIDVTSYCLSQKSKCTDLSYRKLQNTFFCLKLTLRKRKRKNNEISFYCFLTMLMSIYSDLLLVCIVYPMFYDCLFWMSHVLQSRWQKALW